MTFWTLEHLKAVLGGAWLARPTNDAPRPDPATADAHAGGASIDSRSTRPGQVFFALKGERADGHAFVPAAAAAGAFLAVIDNPASLPHRWQDALGPCAVLQVPDARAALLRAAAAYRKSLPSAKFIAVAGSNGKTTTVRLIAAVLRASLRGTASAKSFNNDLGVPLTILNAARSDQFVVCEVGTNAPGEIARLADVVRPDIAVITSIGREHLEGLGSLAGVALEEASLLASLQPSGLAVLPSGVPELESPASKWLARVAGAAAVRVGFDDHADLRVTDARHEGLQGLRFTINDRWTYRVPLIGRHNALNAATAVAVARRLGVPDQSIEAALAQARPDAGASMRLAVSRCPFQNGHITLINDAYNANPESMLAALRTLAEAAPDAPRRIAVLGDMLELGPAAPDLHRQIGDAILASTGPAPIDAVITVGPLAMFIAERLSRKWRPSEIVPIDDRDETAILAAAKALLRLASPGDAVLLKASRGVALERLLPHLAPPAPAPHALACPTGS